MFAGDAASELDALGKDGVPCLDHALGLFVVPLIEQQDGMDISVARVEDVYDADLILLARGYDEIEDLRELGPRHNSVLGAVAR